MNSAAFLATALLTYAAHSAAACVGALLIARSLASPQQRDVLWKTALLAPVLTTIVALSISWMHVDLALVARRMHLFNLPGRKMFVRVIDQGNGPVVSRELIDPVTKVMSIAVLAIGCVCILVALARFVHRRRVLAHALAERRASTEMLANARLTTSELLHSPIALGGREVCLPEFVANEFSPAQRDTLIAHEMAHLDRRDPVWFFIVELISAVSAFQPLVFVVTRAFRRDVELICDEAAVHATHDRHALVGALALLAAPFDARSPILGAATAYDGSPLVLRAERIATLSAGELTSVGPAPLLLAAMLLLTLCALPAISSAPRMTDFPADVAHTARVARREGRIVEMDSTITDHQKRVRVLIK